MGFGEVRLAMKDVCGGGENDARASTTYYLTMARPRPLLTLAHARGFGCWLFPGDLRR